MCAPVKNFFAKTLLRRAHGDNRTRRGQVMVNHRTRPERLQRNSDEYTFQESMSTQPTLTLLGSSRAATIRQVDFCCQQGLFCHVRLMLRSRGPGELNSSSQTHEVVFCWDAFEFAGSRNLTQSAFSLGPSFTLCCLQGYST